MILRAGIACAATTTATVCPVGLADLLLGLVDRQEGRGRRDERQHDPDHHDEPAAATGMLVVHSMC